MSDYDKILSNYRAVLSTIKDSCVKSDRNQDEITILCVTKKVDAAIIRIAHKAGFCHFGENRVKPALSKVALLDDLDVAWHLIGNLQTNKVSQAVKLFDVIQSVDSLKIALLINDACLKIDKVINVFLEVNISGESQKFGFNKTEIIDVIHNLKHCTQLKINGLMAMAPFCDDPEATRPYFKEMKDLFDSLKSKRSEAMPLKYLSMGMSRDYAIAIEEGANMVRIGAQIFEGID